MHLSTIFKIDFLIIFFSIFFSYAVAEDRNLQDVPISETSQPGVYYFFNNDSEIEVMIIRFQNPGPLYCAFFSFSNSGLLKYGGNYLCHKTIELQDSGSFFFWEIAHQSIKAYLGNDTTGREDNEALDFDIDIDGCSKTAIASLTLHPRSQDMSPYASFPDDYEETNFPKYSLEIVSGEITITSFSARLLVNPDDFQDREFYQDLLEHPYLRERIILLKYCQNQVSQLEED